MGYHFRTHVVPLAERTYGASALFAERNLDAISETAYGAISGYKQYNIEVWYETTTAEDGWRKKKILSVVTPAGSPHPLA